MLATYRTSGLVLIASLGVSSDVLLAQEVGPRGLDEETFRENLGQWPEGPGFVAHAADMRVGVVKDAILIERMAPCDPQEGVLLELAFEGAASGVRLRGLDERPGHHHFYRGDDPSRWVRNVRSFAGVRMEGVYSGIDVVVRRGARGLEYDLVVAPGADPSQIILRCDGMDALQIMDERELVLSTALGELCLPIGRTWQVAGNGSLIPREAFYRRIDERRVAFVVPDFEPALELVIDPELLWSTYLGATGGARAAADLVFDVAYDVLGNVTLTGRSEGGAEGGHFPRTPGAFQSPGAGFDDVFVTRFRQSDGALVYSCVIGGFAQIEYGRAVAVDSSGRAVVVGDTSSDDFPTTEGAYDERKDSNQNSAFVLRLSHDASELEYSTIVEGTATGSQANAVALASSGAAVVGGWTSPGFPSTPGAFNEVHNGVTDAFALRLNPAGSDLEWSTFLGNVGFDEIHGLVLDDQENVTAAGEGALLPTTPGAFQETPGGSTDAFVTRFDPTGSRLLWSTLLGGSRVDRAVSVALGRFGDVFVTGETKSLDFPTNPGVLQTSYAGGQSDGFVTHLDATGSTALYSTYLGGSGFDYEFFWGLHVDASGLATVSGSTSADYPITPGVLRTTAEQTDAFVTRLDRGATRLFYSEFLGGPGDDDGKRLAVSPEGRITLVGENSLGPYPTTPGAFRTRYTGGQTDLFVSTFDPLFEGVRIQGRSKPACSGPLVMNVTEAPAAGSATFGFCCSAAPPQANGLLLVGGSDLSLETSRPLALGLASLAVHVQSDASGYVETTMPLPLATKGIRFAARYLFLNPPTCGQQGGTSTSNGLIVTVQ